MSYAKNYRLPVKRASGPGKAIKGHGGGLPMAEINEGLFRLTDQTLTVTRCMFCRWTYRGTAAAGRQEAQAHREREHPEILLLPSKRKRRRARTPPRKVA